MDEILSMPAGGSMPRMLNGGSNFSNKTMRQHARENVENVAKQENGIR